MIGSFHSASAVLQDLGLAAAKAAGVLLAAMLLAACMRRRSAAARHLVWTLLLATALLLPVAAVLTPSWNLALLPPPQVAVIPMVETPGPRLVIMPPPVQMPAAVQSTPRSDVQPASNRQTIPMPTLAPTVVPPVPVATAVPRPHLNFSALTLAIWAAGAGVVALHSLIGVVAAFRLARSAQEIAESPLLDAVYAALRELDIRRRITVRTGGHITMPLTTGLLRPVLLLPANAPSWPDNQLQSVLLHELAHVKRHDCATQLLAQLACAMHWFNPLAWFAAARLRAERERACDDVVLRGGADPVDYADLLLAVATSLRRRLFADSIAIAMARRSGLRDRVSRVLSAAVNRRAVNPRIRTFAVLAALFVLLPLAAVRLANRSASAQTAGIPATQPSPPAPVVLPPLPDALPAKQVAIRVLGPDNQPIEIDKIASILTWAQRGDIPWDMGDEFDIHNHYDGGWVLVDAGNLIYAGRGKTAEMEFLSNGNSLKAEGLLPSDKPHDLTLHTLGTPFETGIDESAGPSDVAAGEICGKVVDEKGRPVKGAVVSFPSMIPRRPDQTWRAGTTTAGDGLFHIQAVPRYAFTYMQIEASGFGPRWLVEVPRGKGFTVHLSATTRLRGTLSLPNGSPAAGAEIRLTTDKPLIRENFAPEVSDIPWTTHADATGQYDFPLEPGEYDAKINSPDGSVAREPHLRLPSGQILSLPAKLSAGLTLTLQAMDAVTGRPVPDVQFAFQREGPGEIVEEPSTARTTDANGKASWKGLFPGQAEVGVQSALYSQWWVKDDDHRDVRGIDSLRPNISAETPVVIVEMQPAVRVTGKVLSPDGKPIAGAEVNIAGLITGDARYQQSTNDQGDFALVFPELPWEKDKQHAVVAHDPKHRWANAVGEQFVPHAGDSHSFTVRLTPGGRINGRVVDAAGKPVAHIKIHAVASDGVDCSYYDPTTMTDENGRFDLAAMRPATYAVYADAEFGMDVFGPVGPTAQPYPKPVTIAEGDQIDAGNLVYTGPPPGKASSGR